ncbi:acyl carrier protein [Streptomyces sp. NPDC029674]|uniref:acyl carrier protein n=1 Tax=Streptomyces sp. NPDC029674 TaxID=3365297 RepID=UPI00384F65EB
MNATQHVYEVLRQSFGVDAQAVPDDTALQQLRMDSLALEEFRVLIEERLDIDLDDARITSRDTVAHLVHVVAARATS